MLKEFRDFLMRGNVVDLAVAVIVGAAFGAIVNSFVNDMLMQIVAALVAKPDFSSVVITIGASEIKFGSFINTVITFVLVSGAVFFLVVKPMNAVFARRTQAAATEPSDEVKLLTEIRDLLARR